jgi:nitrite reductase/ring-hydroxylating ferredoxin subunit
MTEYKRVARLADLATGQRLAVWISGVKVLLLSIGGTIYAVDEQCTHMKCSLLTGPVRGTIVACPCHQAEFDLRNGRVLKGPATVDLPTYAVKVEGDEVLVEEKPPEIV